MWLIGRGKEMIVQGAAVINLIIAVVGCVVCILSLFSILNGIKRDPETASVLFLLLTFLLIRNFCVAFLQVTQGQYGTFWQNGIYIAGFGTYLFSILGSYQISHFVLNNVIYSEKGILRLRIILNVFLAFCIVTLIWAQRSGLLVKIDDSGMYYMGDFYYYSNLLSVAYMAFDIVMLIFYGKKNPQKQRLVYGLLIMLPLLATLAKPFYKEIHLATFLSSVSVSLIVLMIIGENTKEFRRQEALREQLEIDLLLSQIQPHFLFNVLYIIQEICHIDPETAAAAIEAFSKYLRHNMDSISIRAPIPFEEELEHVRHYVSLQQLRFGDALQVQYELECTDFKMPTLTLQPIVENAVRYGVRMAPEGRGKVLVRTIERPDCYEIDVIDNGPGFDENNLPEDGMSHTGLSNVRDRLRHMSGGDLIVNSAAGEGTTVRMILPKE